MTSVKQGGFNSGHTKSLQGRSGANDRSHSPVTEVEPSSIRQNGEFTVAFSHYLLEEQIRPFSASIVTVTPLFKTFEAFSAP